MQQQRKCLYQLTVNRYVRSIDINSVAIRSQFFGDDPFESAAAPFMRHQRFLRARKSARTFFERISGLLHWNPSRQRALDERLHNREDIFHTMTAFAHDETLAGS